MNRVNVVVSCAASALLIASACSVFEPPLLEADGSGGRGDGGSSGGNTSSGGRSSGGNDASVGGLIGTGGDESGGAGGGGAESGGAGGKVGSGGEPSTEPFWITKNSYGCDVKRLPTSEDRPATSDAGESLPPMVFAIYRARHGSTNDDQELTPSATAWMDIGFDLDGKCTRSETCEDPETQTRVDERACKNTQTIPFDGNHCIDNSIGKLFKQAADAPSVGDWFGLNEQDWNCELWRGGFSTLIKVSNYNGRLNDHDVRVDQYISTGLQTPAGWQCRANNRIEGARDAKWWTHTPWPKEFHWKVAERSIDLGSNPPGDELPGSVVRDVKAYVRNGYLVARFPERSEFWWNGENASVPGFRDIMQNPVSIAKLVEDPASGEWSIPEGILTSVVTPGDMLKGFQEMGFCENMCTSFEAVRTYLNSQQDVFSDLDETLPDSPCDAMSIAIAFSARPATATKQDVVPVAEPIPCPKPRHPDAPQHGCVCGPTGCLLPDAG